MGKKSTDGAKTVRPAISPSDIKIQSGPLPIMRAPASASKAYDAVKQAILDMPPGSWFIVPGTPGRTGIRLMGVRGMLTRFKNNTGGPDKAKLTGVAWNEVADGGGLLVRKAAEPGESGGGLGGGAGGGVLPQSGARPKAQRRSEDM